MSRVTQRLKWGLVYLAIVLGAMFLLYTLPRWIWGWGLDMMPSL